MLVLLSFFLIFYAFSCDYSYNFASFFLYFQVPVTATSTTTTPSSIEHAFFVILLWFEYILFIGCLLILENCIRY